MKLNKMCIILSVGLIFISVVVFEKINSEENTKNSSSSHEIARSVSQEEPNKEFVQKNESSGSDETGNKIIKEEANSDPIH